MDAAPGAGGGPAMTPRGFRPACSLIFVLAGLLPAVAPCDSPGHTEVGIGGHASPESYPGMTLAWREEFDGPTLDPGRWKHETGPGGTGQGSVSRQYYRPENTTLDDGFLIITARKERFDGHEFTASRIVTRGLRDFRFGRIDIRARLPKGQGMWPSFRLLGVPTGPAGRPAGGEIDIMELIGGRGRENTVFGTLRWRQQGGLVYEGGSYTLPDGDFTEQFHVFSIVWSETSIRWLVDGQPFLEQAISEPALAAFHEPFYLEIGLAVGGERPGAPDPTTRFPQRLVVDYIRLFR